MTGLTRGRLRDSRLFIVRPGLGAALASGNVTSARVISVNAGRVEVGRLGLGGDEQVDKPAHGGPEQALYAYALEDLDWWVERLGRELPSGMFGENITTAGLDVTGAMIGEIWDMGTARVQVTGPRIPCVMFAGRMDERHWVKRFAAARRPGAYLRVLREGAVGAGDRLEVVSRPAERVTIAESMTAYYGDAVLMRRLLRVEGRGLDWDNIAPGVLGRATADS